MQLYSTHRSRIEAGLIRLFDWDTARTDWSSLMHGHEGSKLFIGKHEIDRCDPVRANSYGFLPGPGFGEDRSVDAMLSKHIIGLLFAGQTPPLVPGDDLISSAGHIGELESTALIGHCVVRVRCNKHLCVHPDMSAVAAQVHQTWSLHGA